jgi:hypothetical protein
VRRSDGGFPSAGHASTALQFIIATIAYAINERMARRIDYLMEEVRVLREAYAETTGRKRIALADGQRRRLAVKGEALTPEERNQCSQLFVPIAQVERREVSAHSCEQSQLQSTRRTAA